MKKVLSIIILSLASITAFAITETQKADFVTLVKTEVKGAGEQFMSSVDKVSKTELAKQIATWADSDPIAYHNWVTEPGGIIGVERINMPLEWVVRKANSNKRYEPFSYKDAVINDFRATFYKCRDNKEAYESLVSSKFVVSNLPMPWQRIWGLALQYNDYNTILEYVPELEIAKRFGEVLKVIRKAKPTSKEAYDVYCLLTTQFIQYKDSVKAVKENWEILQADKNEVFMQYYTERKLQSLEK